MRSLLNTLSARLLVGSAIPLVLFVAVGLVAAVAISRLLAALALEKRTHEVIIQAFHLQKQVDRLRVARLPKGKGELPDDYLRARANFEHIGGELAAKVA